MKSPTTVKLKNFADMELAYRRLRDDISNIETRQTTVSNTAALAATLRRCLIQAVLEDRYLGSWIDTTEEETAAVTYTPISTATELHTIVRGNLKGKYQLTANIDMTADCSVGGAYYNGGEGWEPLATIDGGEGGNMDSGFQGIFDGNGHTITGLVCNRDDTDYQSLFGYVGLGGIVKNLIMENVTVTARSQVGAVCGGVAGLLYNCHVVGTSSFTGKYTSLGYTGNVGSICGDNDGVIRLCTVTGATVRGLRDVGGVIGDNDGLLQYCSFFGDVYVSVIGDAGLISGDNKGFIEAIPMNQMPVNKGTIYGCLGVGTVNSFDIAEIGSPTPAGNLGLGVGDNRGGKISCCWVSGMVTGKNPDVAGFVGNNNIGDNELGETKDSLVSNCYCLATVVPLGSIPEGSTAGGFVGKNKGGQIYNCYCDSLVTIGGGVEREHVGDFCGNNSDDDWEGVISLSYYNVTTGLIGSSDGGIPKTTSQLKEQSTFEGWNFNTIWSIDAGIAYPTLPDLPEASDSLEDGYIEIFPIDRIGVNALTGDVRPKVIAGTTVFAELCEDDVVRTPIIVEDYNFPVSRTDIEAGAVGKDQLGDKAGNDILGEGLRWDTSENIRVNEGDGLSIDGEDKLQVKQGFGLDISNDGELVVDPGEFNGDGLDYDEETGLLSVDLTELPVTDLDLTDLADEVTIGFDDPKAYVATKEYSEKQKVSDGGVNYVSLQDANTGNTPASSPTWWESIGTQKVLAVEDDIVGDGLRWSTKKKIEIQQGNGLDINGSNELVVDPSEFIAAGGGLDVDGSNNLVVDPGDFNGTGLDIDGSGNLEVDPIETLVARTASAASGDITPTKDLDIIIRTAQGAALAINNYSGDAPAQGQKLIIRLKDDATGRGVSFGTKYRGIIASLPTTTHASKLLYMGFLYNSTDDKYDMVALAEEA